MSQTKQTGRTVVPTWLVSAPNGTNVILDDHDSGWWPFGPQHARQIGSRVTACGLAEVEWQMFWDMPFPADAEASCRDCRTAVELSEASLEELGGTR